MSFTGDGHIHLKLWIQMCSVGSSTSSKKEVKVLPYFKIILQPISLGISLKTILKAFYNYLEDERIVMLNPLRQTRIKLHEPFLLPKTIPLNTIELLLRCAYARKQALTTTSSYQYANCLRDIAVLELLFATGMRVSELCSIKSNTIDLRNGTIKIYGKGSKERILTDYLHHCITAGLVLNTQTHHLHNKSRWPF